MNQTHSQHYFSFMQKNFYHSKVMRYIDPLHTYIEKFPV